MRNISIIRNLTIDRTQITCIQIMQILMTSDAGICFQLCQGTVQKLLPLCRCFDLQSGSQLLILRSDAYRTFTRTTDTILLAGCRNQSSRCYCHSIRTHSQSLGEIRRYPQPAGDHQRNIISSHSIKILAGTIQSINGRNTGRITNQLRAGACSAAASVDRNKSGSAKRRTPNHVPAYRLRS